MYTTPPRSLNAINRDLARHHRAIEMLLISHESDEEVFAHQREIVLLMRELVSLGYHTGLPNG